MNSGGRGLRGGAVTTGAQVIRFATQFLAVIVLSRLLDPSDFGIVAMAGVVLSLGDLLRDFGVPTAALQARQLSSAQASNLFWINLAMGVFFAIVIAASGPLLSALYGQAELSAIVPVLSLGLIINGVQAQWLVHLARSGRFVAIAVSDVVAPILGLAAAVYVALQGGGYWALVVQGLAAAASLTVMRAIMAEWMPGWPHRHVGTASIVRSGADIGLAQLLGFAASNVDSVVIGIRFGAEPLGVYNRAFQLMSVPISGLLGPLTNVVIPTARQLAKEGRSLVEIMLRVQFIGSLPLVGSLSVLIAAAPHLIPLLLGERWADASFLFQILAAGAIFQCLSYVSYWVFLLEHKERALLNYNLLTKPLAIISVLVGSFFGVTGVAVGYALSLMIAWPISLVWLNLVAGHPFLIYFRAGMSVLVPGAVSIVIGVAVTIAIGGKAHDLVITALVSGCVVLSYLIVAIVLPQSRGGIRRSWPLVISMFRRGQ